MAQRNDIQINSNGSCVTSFCVYNTDLILNQYLIISAFCIRSMGYMESRVFSCLENRAVILFRYLVFHFPRTKRFLFHFIRFVASVCYDFLYGLTLSFWFFKWPLDFLGYLFGDADVYYVYMCVPSPIIFVIPFGFSVSEMMRLRIIAGRNSILTIGEAIKPMTRIYCHMDRIQYIHFSVWYYYHFNTKIRNNDYTHLSLW